MKNNNLKKIFNLFKKEKRLTALDISNKIKVSIPTVNKHIAYLEKEAYIRKVEDKKTTGGRRAKIFEFNDKRKYSLAVELKSDYYKIILVDLNLNIISENKYKIDSFDKFSVELKKELSYFIFQNELTKSNIAGIGFSLPGVVDNKKYILKNPANSNFNNLCFADIKKDFDVPLYIENEANCSAHAEQIARELKDKQTLLFVSITEGIGGGYIVNNKIQYGKNRIAGEIGHMTIEIDGKLCSCGDRGCWMQYASSEAMERDYSREFKKELSFDQIFENPKEHEEFIDKYIKNIAIGIKNLIFIYDPDYVIIGGYVCKYKKMILHKLKESILLNNVFFNNKNLIIDFSTYEGKSGILGAALLPIDNLF